MKHVYFIKPQGCVGPIKIGSSVTPPGRLESMTAWSPVPLELIVAVPGGKEAECAIHHRFAHLSLHGEWFAVDAELLGFISAVVETGTLPAFDAPATATTSRATANIKSQIACAVGRAEEFSHGHRMVMGTGRPAEVAAILDTFNGPMALPPTPEEQQVLARYVADLRARPFTTHSTISRHEAWQAYRDGPLGLKSKRLDPWSPRPSDVSAAA